MVGPIDKYRGKKTEERAVVGIINIAPATPGWKFFLKGEGVRGRGIDVFFFDFCS